ncbi:oligosaccharide flippase family protein [Enterococcus olivae]
MKKFISNFFYQSLFQIIKLTAPLITVPIVSHALGPTNIGLYNFTQSIAQYFILLSGLGISLYGQRSIARVRDDRDLLSKKFWELVFLIIISTIISFSIYSIIFLRNQNWLAYFLQGFTIIAVVFDISWFFMGMEDFKLTSLRSLTVTLITFICIVFFVNDSSDTYVYIAIQSLGILFSQLVMWPFLRGKVHFIRPSIYSIKDHFLECLQYFVPQISVTLYTNLNKTILGLFRNNTEVGFFSNAFLIIIVIRTLISTVDTVLLPKLSNMSEKNSRQEILKLLNISLNTQFYFTIPATMGVIAIAPKLIPWFFGVSFYPVVELVSIMSILIVIVPMGMSISRQWLIPTGNLKSYNISIFVGGVIGIISNIFLIPWLGAVGAALSLVISEIFVTFTRGYDFIKTTHFRYDIKSLFYYLISSGIMYIGIYVLTRNMGARLLTTFLQIAIGIIIYLFSTTVFKVNPIILYLRSKKLN